MNCEIDFNSVVSGLSPHDFVGCTDEYFAYWANFIVDSAIEDALYKLQERQETMTFPVMGYSTNQLFESWDEYYAFKSSEIREELDCEREPLAQFLKNWAAQS